MDYRTFINNLFFLILMPALAHLGLGLITKRFAPQIPLWGLLISAMFLDILSFIFLFGLWISHGLFMLIIWTIIAMLFTTLITYHLKLKKGLESKLSIWNKEILYTSLIIGLVVFSHWILDFIGWPMKAINPSGTGVPLLFDDNVNIGLGVYSTWTGALLMDLGVFAIGLVIYIQYRLKNKINKTEK